MWLVSAILDSWAPKTGKLRDTHTPPVCREHTAGKCTSTDHLLRVWYAQTLSEAFTWLLLSSSHQPRDRCHYSIKCGTKTKEGWVTNLNSDLNGGTKVLILAQIPHTIDVWCCLCLKILKQSLSSLTQCPCHLLQESESPVLQNSSFWTWMMMVHFWCYTCASWCPHFLYTRN